MLALHHRLRPVAALLSAVALFVCAALASDAAGVIHIRPEDLPEPGATESVGNPPITLPQMAPDLLALPNGFEVKLWADGLQIPRQAYIAPNGDVLVVETGARKVTLMRDTDDDGVADFRVDLLAVLFELLPGGIHDLLGLILQFDGGPGHDAQELAVLG